MPCLSQVEKEVPGEPAGHFFERKLLGAAKVAPQLLFREEQEEPIV